MRYWFRFLKYFSVQWMFKHLSPKDFVYQHTLFKLHGKSTRDIKSARPLAIRIKNTILTSKRQEMNQKNNSDFFLRFDWILPVTFLILCVAFFWTRVEWKLFKVNKFMFVYRNVLEKCECESRNNIKRFSIFRLAVCITILKKCYYNNVFSRNL